jgi:hypothetical protein
MALICPYCQQDNLALSLVCRACSRDIAIPEALAAERLDLAAKRDAVRAELQRTREEIAAIRARRKNGTR